MGKARGSPETRRTAPSGGGAGLAASPLPRVRFYPEFVLPRVSLPHLHIPPDSPLKHPRALPRALFLHWEPSPEGPPGRAVGEGAALGAPPGRASWRWSRLPRPGGRTRSPRGLLRLRAPSRLPPGGPAGRRQRQDSGPGGRHCLVLLPYPPGSPAAPPLPLRETRPGAGLRRRARTGSEPRAGSPGRPRGPASEAGLGRARGPPAAAALASPQGAEVPLGPGGAARALGLPAVLRGGAPGARAAALLQRLPLQAVLRHPGLGLPERPGRSPVRALGGPGPVLCAGLGGRHLLLPALQGLREAAGGLLLPREGGRAAEKGGGQQEQPLLLPAFPETLPHDAQLVLELLLPDPEHPHRAVLLLGPHRPDPVQLHLRADRLHPVLRHLPGRHLLLGDRAQAAGHRPGGADPGHPHQALQPQASQAG